MSNNINFEIDENYKLIPLDKIRPNDYNNNVMSKEKFDILVENIKTYGFDEPIILAYIGGDYEIIDGEHRYKAVKKLGYKFIPAKIKKLNKLQRKLLTLSYNKLRGSDNPEKTKKLLRDIKNNYDITEEEIIEVTGYSPLELRLYLTEPKEEEVNLNFELEKQFYNIDSININIDKDVRDTKHGDIWKLGNHYLLCYNSADEKDIKKISEIIPSANLILVDIPLDLINGVTQSKSTIFLKSITDYLNFFISDNNFLLLKTYNIIDNKTGHKSSYSYFLIKHLKKFYRYINSIIIIEDREKKFEELSDGFYTIEVFQYEDSFSYAIQTMENDNDINILLDNKIKNIKNSNKGLKTIYNVLKSTEEVNRSHHKALISTFTLKDDTVLEFYVRDCSSLLACENSKRKYVGIVKSSKDLKKMIGFWEDYTKNRAEYFDKGEIDDRNKSTC